MDFDPRCPSALLLSPLPIIRPTTTKNDKNNNNNKNNNNVDLSFENLSTSSMFRTLLAQDGTGCCDEEISTLMKLLDARDETTASVASSTTTTTTCSTKKISQSYRRILVECLEELDERLTTTNINLNTNTSNNNNLEKEGSGQIATNLELLKLTHAIAHLSEVRLLPPISDNGKSFSFHNNNNGYDAFGTYVGEQMIVGTTGDNGTPSSSIITNTNSTTTPRRHISGYSSSNNGSSSQSQGGTVTADIVRYLRYHHVKDPFQAVNERLLSISEAESKGEMEEDDDISNNNNNNNDDSIDTITIVTNVSNLMDLPQPEYYADGGLDCGDNDDEGQWNDDRSHIPPYWELVHSLVSAGRLEDAWAALSRHSACRRCCLSENTNENDNDPMAAGDALAFATIRTLLLSAPLPGGRNDIHDDGLDHHSSSNVDVGVDVDGDDNNNNETATKVVEEWMPGVPSDGWKLWDAPSTSSSSSIATNRNIINNNDEDYYPEEVINQRNRRLSAANATHAEWSSVLQRVLGEKGNGGNDSGMVTNGGDEHIANLNRRIPFLNECVWNILLGKQQKKGGMRDNNNNTTASWAETLLSEMLYKNPSIRGEDVYVRARVAMENDTRCDAVQREQQQQGGDNNSIGGGSFDNIVLSILGGNAGSVVQALHVFGGGSGAALPAVMVSFFSLF